MFSQENYSYVLESKIACCPFAKLFKLVKDSFKPITDRMHTFVIAT